MMPVKKIHVSKILLLIFINVFTEQVIRVLPLVEHLNSGTVILEQQHPLKQVALREMETQLIV